MPTYAIEIAEARLSDMRKERAQMEKQKTNLRGQIQSLRDVITQNKRLQADALRMMQQARERGKTAIMVLKARSAGRLKDSNFTLEQLLVKLEVLYRVLTKMGEAADFLIEDTDDMIKNKKRERKAVLAGWNAMKSARAIMRGDPDKMELFNAAIEFLTEDNARKWGEIEEFNEISRTFIEGMDLQNGVYEQEALEMLEKWEQNPDSIILGSSAKNALLSASYDDHRLLDLDVPDPTPEVLPAQRIDSEKKRTKYVTPEASK